MGFQASEGLLMDAPRRAALTTQGWAMEVLSSVSREMSSCRISAWSSTLMATMAPFQRPLYTRP